MRRVAGFVLRNWPLKLGAVLLATVLYSGLVLSQNVRTFDSPIRIDTIRTPPNATLLQPPGEVTLVRYRAPLDVGILAPDDFRASIDLSRVDVDPEGRPQLVPVTLVALDRRIEVIDFVPTSVPVQLDPVVEREVEVRVSNNQPPGVEIGERRAEPTTVTVRGARSRVDLVRWAQADVSIDGSAINVDRLVELVAVDELNNPVPNVTLEPSFAQVQITVARELASVTLPIDVRIVGDLAPGYRVASVEYEPLSVLVSGEQDVVSQMQTVVAELDVSGRERDFDVNVPLVLGEGVTASVDEVDVTVRLSEAIETRTYAVGLEVTGSRPDLSYQPAVTQVTVTLRGPVLELQALDVSRVEAVVDVTGLDVGSHDAPVTVSAPDGLTVEGASHERVTVEVQAPLETPAASPTAGIVDLTVL